MSKQSKVTGVILAGGLARRMAGQDKGLVPFRQQPMVRYAIDSLSGIVGQLLINANRNIEQYQSFGYPVVCDVDRDFSGPLAGVYAAMLKAEHPVLLVMPCDSPFMSSEALQTLLDARAAVDADIAVAFDGQRIQPVFIAVKTALKQDLQAYLARGERKIDHWFKGHACIEVDLSAYPDCFSNINSLLELNEWEDQ